jgi:alpha-amylase/alpha-mannosidase (GH57 family)
MHYLFTVRFSESQTPSQCIKTNKKKHANSVKINYKGIGSAFKSIYHEEGIKGFYKGLFIF